VHFEKKMQRLTIMVTREKTQLGVLIFSFSIFFLEVSRQVLALIFLKREKHSHGFNPHPLENNPSA
jgi:hypothetical protein